MSSYLGRHLNRIRAAFNKGDMETARREQAAVLRVTGVRDQFGETNLTLSRCFPCLVM